MLDTGKSSAEFFPRKEKLSAFALATSTIGEANPAAATCRLDSEALGRCATKVLGQIAEQHTSARDNLRAERRAMTGGLAELLMCMQECVYSHMISYLYNYIYVYIYIFTYSFGGLIV